MRTFCGGIQSLKRIKDYLVWKHVPPQIQAVSFGSGSAIIVLVFPPSTPWSATGAPFSIPSPLLSPGLLGFPGWVPSLALVFPGFLSRWRRRWSRCRCGNKSFRYHFLDCIDSNPTSRLRRISLRDRSCSCVQLTWAILRAPFLSIFLSGLLQSYVHLCIVYCIRRQWIAITFQVRDGTSVETAFCYDETGSCSSFGPTSLASRYPGLQKCLCPRLQLKYASY